jgi:protein-tyrosine phosphatase
MRGPDLFWIPSPWQGRLAISTRPRGGDWLEEEAQWWRDAGADLVVSLLTPAEEAELRLTTEHDVVEHTGAHFVTLAIEDQNAPAKMLPVIERLREIKAELERGRNVVIHCRQGVGRSGMIASALLVLGGATPSEAMRRVSESRGMTVPETRAQSDWLQAMARELAATKAASA